MDATKMQIVDLMEAQGLELVAQHMGKFIFWCNEKALFWAYDSHYDERGAWFEERYDAADYLNQCVQDDDWACIE